MGIRPSRWLRWALGLALAAPASLAHAGGKRVVPRLRTARRAAPAQGARALVRLPITVHVAMVKGQPVTSMARVKRWVDRANRELASSGMTAEIVAVRAMPGQYRSVTRWRHRRALARRAARDGSIHMFVVDELDTARRRSHHRQIRGLHWRYRGFNRDLRGRQYVVVTVGAPMTTLAHEFGHLFGLRHSGAVDNIMCSCRKGSRVRFTHQQGRNIHAGARRFLSRSGGAGLYAVRRNR